MAWSTYDESKRGCRTMLEDGQLFDAGTDARLYITLKDINAPGLRHNEIAVLTPFVVKQYKTDMTCSMPHLERCEIECKGYIGQDAARVAELVEMFRTAIPDPRIPIGAFVLTTPKETRIWDRYTLEECGDWMPAAYYYCEDCGHGFIAPIDHPVCPICEEEGKHVCDNFNEYANAVFREEHKLLQRYGTTKERPRTELENKLAAIGLKRAEQANILYCVTQKNKVDKRFTHWLPNGLWRPDIMYFEDRSDVETFGTANSPVVFIEAYDPNTDYDEDRQRIHEQLASDIFNTNNNTKKVVLLTPNGILVADKQSNGEYIDGGAYNCPKCGRGFYATNNNDRCPFCGEVHTTKVSK